ncbi:hypothetical protein DDV21_010285 [Streptococcus chenjunshii]|uniref:Uncharacterized protein n=1 Tax=Streptococcus chenjunshii TaxID=2173853 RepID=A0A372KLP7_9STRE|nr:hypothetical protein [Streptococcus chenjunshii]AXQ79435.1 hypothetical protein DDV21_010285 [Streptococcus chenjunshii]RFU51107.1 hypothetical protein DDV22_05215 [Streptococcus chenjunshii]RFU53205.1 hypothetical protein DDV23_05725 [Streptococcus chenjunshii]
MKFMITTTIGNVDYYLNDVLTGKYPVTKKETSHEIGMEEGRFIEVNSLEELLKIKEKTGYNLIISKSPENSEIPCIEIYNGWRE